MKFPKIKNIAEQWRLGLFAFAIATLAACGGPGASSSSSSSSSGSSLSSSSTSSSSSSSSSSTSGGTSACQDAVNKGKVVYQEKCASCHGANVSGVPYKLNINSATYAKTLNPGVGEPALPLHLYTAKYMPNGFGGSCVGDCANNSAAYIKSLSATPWCPSTTSSSSSGGIDPTVVNTAAPSLRRLNRAEYDNTIRDLFGSKLRIAATQFSLESQGPDNLFYKDGKGRTVLADYVVNYIDAAEKISAEAVANNIPELACATQNEGCITNIIVNFGKRVWRRPLTADEQTGLLQIYKLGVTRAAPFNENLTSVLQAMLLSPNFIFLPEIDQGLPAKHPLNAYELAARLSYFIWSSTPDQELMATADNNSLLTDAVLRAQVKRMLKDPRADNLVNDFSTQWLKFSREYSKSEPNVELFPEYSPLLHAAMVQETTLFMQNLIFNNQPVNQLATANYSFLNQRLKGFYGVTAEQPITPAVVPDPITVQAENYVKAFDTTANNQGNGQSTMGVDVEATTDVGGGYNVGYIAVGEWLEFNVSIPADGDYSVSLRVAALNATGGLKVTAGIGPNIISTENINVPATGGYQKWQTLEKIKLGKLYKGMNTVRLDMTGANFNINWFMLVPVSAATNSDQFEKVTWAGQQRFGVITHGSILTATSDNIATIPVRRGVWVLNSLLCDAPPLPEFIPPPLDEDSAFGTPVSTRERFEIKHRKPQCVNCHQFIDPIGFGLENYGPIGKWRTIEERGYYTTDIPRTFIKIGPWAIDSSGKLPESGAFNGPKQLSEIIGSSSLLPMCVAKHLATYAIGRNVVAYAPGRVEKEDLGLINSIYQKTLANGNRFEDMLEEVVMSEAFRNRTSAQ